MNAADSALRQWGDAAVATLDELAGEVRHRAKVVRDEGDADAIHDLRTATRRLRTALTIYGDVTPNGRSDAVGRELKRVARRLGAVRDLDVLIDAIDDTHEDGAEEASALHPFRDALVGERRRAAERLATELARRRFKRSLSSARHLATAKRPDPHDPVGRVADRAPALIWGAFGGVLAFDLDPATADPALIHEMRIAAKKLRYTLEAFQPALGRITRLVGQVTALQDAAGDMHDAIVARDRATAFLSGQDLEPGSRRVVRAFATDRNGVAQDLRATVGRRLTTVRGPSFRRSLDHAIVAMGRRRTRSTAA